MVVELNTNFNEEEKKLLSEYKDINIKLFIDTDKLVEKFYIWDNEKKVITDKIVEEYAVKMPNRMFGVFHGFWFVECKEELGTWHMGDLKDDGTYSFFGNYGDLEKALRSM